MARNALLRSQLARRDIWKRAAVERLTEPLHLNLASVGVALFGGVRAKAAFDLLVRRQHAYGLLKAADEARARGLARVTVVELGVASGTGLLNICELGARITEETGVEFRVAGFDTGEGMPPPADYRDHPELYKEGWFPMDRAALEGRLPANAELHFGPIAETMRAFVDGLGPRPRSASRPSTSTSTAPRRTRLPSSRAARTPTCPSSPSTSTTSRSQPTRATRGSCSRSASSTTSTSCASSTGTGTSPTPASSSGPSG